MKRTSCLLPNSCFKVEIVHKLSITGISKIISVSIRTSNGHWHSLDAFRIQHGGVDKFLVFKICRRFRESLWTPRKRFTSKSKYSGDIFSYSWKSLSSFLPGRNVISEIKKSCFSFLLLNSFIVKRLYVFLLLWFNFSELLYRYYNLYNDEIVIIIHNDLYISFNHVKQFG